CFVAALSLNKGNVLTELFFCVLSEEYHFKQWVSQHNKLYTTEEYYHRLGVFTENKRTVDRHNAGNNSFTMGLNQFSDLTFEEFKKFYLQTQICSVTKGTHVLSTGPYPEFVDWRTKGNFVTPVKNQGFCGSCWTFSTTGCLESVIAIATGKLISLYDEKAMVDAVAQLNPITFCFDVTPDFKHYKDGYTKCHSTADSVNHAVLAVGYGSEDNEKPYWIVKNSWGTAWGKDGYFLIERGKNMCGLATCSSYPLPLV
uniref:Pro-cathepsin H-like n=1 Tax=Kryptolebias marmoratus TaxID=37003 RepID=A0A3Q3GJD6_KRYMA